MIKSQAAPLVLHTRCVTGTGGGPEKTILNSPRFLRNLGYDCLCAYLHPPADDGFRSLERRADAACAKIIGIPDHGPFDLNIVRQITRLCREQNVAIWHGHDYKTNALGLLVRRFWPMRLVTTVHGWVQHTRRTPLYYAIDKYCLKRYEEVICVSNDLYEQCLTLGVKAARCKLIHNGIDTHQFRRRSESQRGQQQFVKASQHQIIGAMGRLSDEKGFDLLIRAIAELHRRGSQVELWIAGEGPARDKLQAIISEMGMADSVQLLGHVDDVLSFYESLDVFALSSLREGLPNVLLEAMALEVPVVATRIAGIPSLIDDQQSGVLVDAGSVSSLVAALERLLNDEPLRRRLSTGGRQRIEASFSFERRMQKVASLYDTLLGRKPAAAVELAA
jgi:glycosyltransferase involved in cell wall biosynthesis